jgi:hypothetical protein
VKVAHDTIHLHRDLSIEFGRVHLLIHGVEIERKNPSGAKTTVYVLLR